MFHYKFSIIYGTGDVNILIITIIAIWWWWYDDWQWV